ncbi:hypothetical protein HC891_18410, partial [Candidatus Gracilibacteria bacterium]|nr:hypothetical protein [Candidatus Gracilibacteria bacterium]
MQRAILRYQLIDIGVIVFVELLKIVPRVLRKLPPTPGSQHIRQRPIRIRESQLDRVLADFLSAEAIHLRGGQPVGSWAARAQFLVHQDIVDVEQDIVGPEWLAIAPLHAVAEGKDVLARIRADVDLLRNTRLDIGEVGFPLHQVFPLHCVEHATPCGAAAYDTLAHRAAVRTLFKQGCDHLGVVGRRSSSGGRSPLCTRSLRLGASAKLASAAGASVAAAAG